MEEVYEIEVYETDNGKAPFLTWQTKLAQGTRDLITARLGRLRLGNFGDAKALKGVKGLYELRIHNGPGYRVYFGRKGSKVVILLCGGTKSTQKRDVDRAKRYWTAYLETEDE